MAGDHRADSVGRRQALAILAGGAAVAACVTADGAPAGPAARTPLTDFIKLRGALDAQLVISFLTGRYHGVQDAVVTPLYGFEAATFARYAPMPDGGFRASSFEIAYFTHLETGAVLDTWRNPYTGADVAVPVTKTEPSLFYVRPDLKIELSSSYPATSMVHRVLPAREIGNEVWVTEETFVTTAVPGQAKPFRYFETITMHAQSSALGAPGVARVRAQCSYVSAVSWRPWQNMGDRPGTLTGQGDGLLGVTMAELPAVWRAATQARFPALYADPLTPLNAKLAAPL